ncbi:MAG TPA: STAS domain-containing protein [Acidobacteriaceae bacterium]|nr:STAS domain-containing protein [Acidobacteriaceae bacterium]
MERVPFSFEVIPGRGESTRILRLNGPLVLQSMFELQSELANNHPALTIFDLTGVPYMDSAGMGVIVNYYVSASRRGQKVVAAGICNRVLDLFKLTHVDTIIPMASSVEEAEGMA